VCEFWKVEYYIEGIRAALKILPVCADGKLNLKPQKLLVGFCY